MKQARPLIAETNYTNVITSFCDKVQPCHEISGGVGGKQFAAHYLLLIWFISFKWF
jgi:hypothetical protein